MKWQLFVALVALIATVQCRPGDRGRGPRREVTEEPDSSDEDHKGVPPHNPKNYTDHLHNETTDRPRPGPPGRGGHEGRHRRDFPGFRGRGPPAGLPPRRGVTEEPNSAEHDHTGVPPHNPKNCTDHPHDETTDRPRPGPPGRGGHWGRHRRDMHGFMGRGPPAGLPPRREVTEEPNSADHDHTGMPPHNPKNCTDHPHDETTDRPRPGPPGRGGPGMPGMGGGRGRFGGRDRRQAAGKRGHGRPPSPPTGSPPTGNPPTGNPPPQGGSGSGAPPPPPPQGGSGSGAPPPPPTPRR